MIRSIPLSDLGIRAMLRAHRDERSRLTVYVDKVRFLFNGKDKLVRSWIQQ